MEIEIAESRIYLFFNKNKTYISILHFSFRARVKIDEDKSLLITVPIRCEKAVIVKFGSINK